MRPWILAETNYGHVRANPYEVAVLPLGATEPHNLHLPYGTDLFEATVLGEKMCETAHARGAKVVLLPAIPYGTETNLRAFPLAMNVYPSTLAAVIGDLVESLAAAGIRKALLLNSHGGNDLKPVLRELYGRTPVHLFVCNWYAAFPAECKEIFAERDDHAGEVETSFALAYFPDLVARDAAGRPAADEGRAAKSRFAALNDGVVNITRPWHLLTTNTGAGDPRAASAEKGKRLVEVIVERLASFLVELSNSPLDERFPY
jgi:creatinine amidohydrolase